MPHKNIFSLEIFWSRKINCEVDSTVIQWGAHKITVIRGPRRDTNLLYRIDLKPFRRQPHWFVLFIVEYWVNLEYVVSQQKKQILSVRVEAYCWNCLSLRKCELSHFSCFNVSYFDCICSADTSTSIALWVYAPFDDFYFDKVFLKCFDRFYSTVFKLPNFNISSSEGQILTVWTPWHANFGPWRFWHAFEELNKCHGLRIKGKK